MHRCASSIAGTSPLFSNTAASKKVAFDPPVFGNSRQFFLMRQNDRADLDDMAADIGLTD